MKRVETGVTFGVDDVNTWWDKIAWKIAGSAHCKVCDRDMWQKDMLNKTTCFHCDDVLWAYDQVFGKYRYHEVDVTFTFKPSPEGGFTVTCDDMPALVTEGDTVKEALEMAGDAFEACVEGYQELGKIGDLPLRIQRLIHENDNIGRDEGMRIMRDRLTVPMERKE